VISTLAQDNGTGSIILSKVRMSSNATCIGKHGVAITVTDMGKAPVAKEMTLGIREAACM
jgi:hypothetical protein